MKMDYAAITFQHIEDNKHLVFVCDGDKKEIEIESEKE